MNEPIRIEVRLVNAEVLQRQLDDATQAVARLATANLCRDEGVVPELRRARDRITELETQNRRLREQVSQNEALQDDLQSNEEYLGRALNRLHGFVKAAYDEAGHAMTNGFWREYVRDLLEDEDFEDRATDLEERLGRAYAVLRLLYNDREGQLAIESLTGRGQWWDELKRWDARTNPRGGDEDGQRQAGAAQKPTPEATTRPESPDGKAAARAGGAPTPIGGDRERGRNCPACGTLHDPAAPCHERVGNGWTH